MLHLRIHDYESVNEYKNAHKIPFRTPLCSRNLSKIKSGHIDKNAFEKIRNNGDYKANKSESQYKKERISLEMKENIENGKLIMIGGRNKDGSIRKLEWKK